MYYHSTRNASEKLTASEAIAKGLAADGGLYVPSQLPPVMLADIRKMCSMDYRERAARIIAPFLPEYSEQEIAALVKASYGENFDDPAVAPTRFTDEATGFLELWHGPTCAFKDMALQMLPHLLTASLQKSGEERGVCILVATSGDTGKAALEGFADVPGTKILVFYPRDGVSDVQRLQMATQTGNNVGVCSVEGNFDDAQTGVKAIFGDAEMARELSERGWFLSSANSINWGRLLPQIVYYFSAYCDAVNAGKTHFGSPVNFCVPTGNFGDILAGWYAKRMGLPVNKLICASNANNVLTDFIRSGVYDRNRPFYVTASPSMDILVSSNLERLLYGITRCDTETAEYMASLKKSGKYTVSQRLRDCLAEGFFAGCCDDRETKAAIAAMWRDKHYLMDTHTAVACKVLADYRAETGDETTSIIVSTASPFKFCDNVLEAIGEGKDAAGTELIDALSKATGLPAPKPLAGLGKRAVRFTECAKKEAMPQVVRDFVK